MSEIFLDTETTGISTRENHRIVEIACIETKDFVPTSFKFHKLINPQRKVSEDAYKVHGYSDAFLEKKDTFDKVVDEFMLFIKDKTLLIHNASFDLNFLNHELKILGKGRITNKVIDTLEVARNKNPGGSNSLDALCKKYNIDLSRRQKHNALLDCELLREVYINLLDIKSPKLSFDEDDREIGLLKNKSFNYSKKIIQPNETEINNHSHFIKNDLKKNFFN